MMVSANTRWPGSSVAVAAAIMSGIRCSSRGMKRRLGWSAEDLWLLIRPILQSGDEIHAEKPRTLSWLMQQFLADRDGTVDKRTLLNVRYCLDLVLLVMGDIRLAELDRERCRTMRETLLPAPKRPTSMASNDLKHMPHVIESDAV